MKGVVISMEQDKLGIKADFFDRLVNCNWFCNCGDGNFDKFEVMIEKSQEYAIACLNSLVRENACLDKQNAMSAWVSEEIPGRWNDIVEEIKRTGYLGKISKKIKSGLKMKDIADTFYEQMLQIYLSGHLPCGYEWKKFRVY